MPTKQPTAAPLNQDGVEVLILNTKHSGLIDKTFLQALYSQTSIVEVSKHGWQLRLRHALITPAQPGTRYSQEKDYDDIQE